MVVRAASHAGRGFCFQGLFRSGSKVHTPAAHDAGIGLLGAISRLVMFEVKAIGRGDSRRGDIVVAYLTTSRWFVETCVKYKLKYKHKGSMATASCIVGYCLLY